MLIQAVCRGEAGRHVESSVARSQRSPVCLSPRVFWPAAMACPPRPSASGASPPHKLPGKQQKKSGPLSGDAASVLLGHRHERLCTVGQLFGVANAWPSGLSARGESAPLRESQMVLEGRGAFLSPSGAAASARAFSAVAGRVGTVQLPAFMRAGECPASLDDPPERKPSRMFS